MADIRHYSKEKETKEMRPGAYKDKIRRHKFTTAYRVLLILAVLGAAAAFVVFQYRRHIYTGYEVVSSVSRERGEDARDIRLGEAVFTYSKDGAHCTDIKGNATWNQTYEMQDPKVAVCQDVVAVGNYNGREIYVQNSGEQLGMITTTMPIRNLAVSASGNVTAVLADTDVTWINTYSPDGKLQYEGQTHMSASGYPMAISLSPSGELLMVSYVYVDAGVVKTNVAFYNLGPVGANQNDYIVGGFTYQDMLVPQVQFMNNDTSFAVGDSRLMIYKGAQVPVSAAEYLFDEEVQSVFYNEEYIGLVFVSDRSEFRYRLDVYGGDGEEVGSFYFSLEYRDLFFEGEQFVVYGDTECLIYNFDGVEKYRGYFSKSVNLMLPTANAYRYIFVTENTIDTIQLK